MSTKKEKKDSRVFTCGSCRYVSHGDSWYDSSGRAIIKFKFYDEDNVFILQDNQYKIENNKLLFTSIGDVSAKSTKSEPYYPNGSPYYGCGYDYRDCEAFNWTYKDYYSLPILGWYEKNNKTYILCKSGYKSGFKAGFKAVLETKTKFSQLRKLK